MPTQTPPADLARDSGRLHVRNGRRGVVSGAVTLDLGREWSDGDHQPAEPRRDFPGQMAFREAVFLSRDSAEAVSVNSCLRGSVNRR